MQFHAYNNDRIKIIDLVSVAKTDQSAIRKLQFENATLYLDMAI